MHGANNSVSVYFWNWYVSTRPNHPAYIVYVSLEGSKGRNMRGLPFHLYLSAIMMAASWTRRSYTYSSFLCFYNWDAKIEANWSDVKTPSNHYFPFSYLPPTWGDPAVYQAFSTSVQRSGHILLISRQQCLPEFSSRLKHVLRLSKTV